MKVDNDSIVNKNTLILSILFIIFLSFISIFYTPVWGDELLYHIPTAKNFNFSDFFSNNPSYNSAYTPFPYILGKIAFNICNSYLMLRLVNFIIFLFLSVAIFKLFSLISKSPLFFTLLLLSNPYLLRASFTYYMFNYGLLFTISSLYYILKKENKYRNIIVPFISGMAVLSQQWMLVFVIAQTVLEVVKFFCNQQKLFALFKALFIQLFFLLPALIIFFIWSGFVPPYFNSHELKPSFEHANSVYANVGFICFFIVLYNYKQFLKYKLLPLVFVVPLIWISIPYHSSQHGLETSTGVTAQICTQLNNQLFIPYKISMLLFICVGILTFILILLKDTDDFSQLLKFIVFGLFVSFTSSIKLGASHIFIIVPFILIFFHKEIEKNNKLKIVLLVQMFLLSIVYMIYYSLFITNNKSL